MRNGRLGRFGALAIAFWFAAAATGQAGHDHCPVHDLPSVPAHGNHSADHDCGDTQAPGHGSHGHGCTCIHTCCRTGPVALPAIPSAPIYTVASAARFGLPHDAGRPFTVNFRILFPTGPPSALTA